ncbi:MAG: hypothetical protein CUN55_09505 [Phototrophicales bacterium]|nr:MAG: hypothetical protein CUN55_09505 [Phototrophicales bacterium]
MIPSFRQVQLSDVVQLHQNCWSETSSAYVEDLVRRAIRLYEQKRGGAIVALHNERAIGYGMLTIWGTLGEISDLIVTPAYRRQGIGTCIIHQICFLAIDLGIYEVEIGALAENVDAIRLYERLGFVRHRQLTLQSGNMPQTLIYLHKNLLTM